MLSSTHDVLELFSSLPSPVDSELLVLSLLGVLTSGQCLPPTLYTAQYKGVLTQVTYSFPNSSSIGDIAYLITIENSLVDDSAI